MTSGQRHKLVPTRIAERLDHVAVILSCTIEHVGKRICIRADAIDLLREKIDGLDETGIAAEAENDLVKTEIAVKHRQQVTRRDRLGMLPMYFIQLFKIGRCHRKRDDPDRHHLELFPHCVDFPHLFWRQPAHHGATIGNSLDQSLLLEFEEGQSHVAAMRAEEIAEILFDQPFARLTPPKDYVLLDALGDDGSSRLARPRHRHPLRFRRSDRAALGWFSGHYVSAMTRPLRRPPRSSR